MVMALRVERSVRRHPLPEVAARFGSRLEGATSRAGLRPLDQRERRRWDVAEALLRRWPGLQADAVCLRRALLVGWVLRDRDPVLRIGVADRDGALTAHAWLEVQGGTIGADTTHRPFVFGPDGGEA
jgi:hypothetical protein